MITKSHTARALALSVATAALLAACATDESLTSATPEREAPATEAATYPVTVTNCGSERVFEEAPDKVLLGYPRTLETLEALGVADAAYGYALGSYAPLPDGYPSDVVEVSPDYIPSKEVVIGASPDFFLGNDEGQIVSEGGIGFAGLRDLEAEAYILGGYCKGAPAPKSIDVVLDDVTQLGEIFGVPEEADTVVDDLESRIAAARELAGDESLSIAFVQVFDGVLYANSGYPASGIIAALGQTNEWADIDANFAEISKEEALTRTPDVLVVTHVGADTAEAAGAEVEKLLAGTPAVESGRVITVDETDFQAGGVAIIDALEKLADDLFGQ